MNGNSMRSMSRGYALTLTFAVLSLPCVGTALGAISLFQQGKFPLDSAKGSGLVCFGGGYALFFLHRLVLWKRSPEALRDAVRWFVAGVLCLVFFANIYLIVRVIEVPHVPWDVMVFATVGVVCQIPSVTWLVRYRNDI